MRRFIGSLQIYIAATNCRAMDLASFSTLIGSVRSTFVCKFTRFFGLRLNLFSRLFGLFQVVVRGDTSGKPTFGPTLILIGENGMKIAHGDSIFSETNSTISVQLTEHGWYQMPQIIENSGRLRQNEYRGDHVTRSQFLAVLSRIESVMLRGSFHSDQAETILIRASLEFSKGVKNEVRSNLVEQCSCPQGYTGLSCEQCDFGYARAYENTTSADHLGICLPCSCNGHAETCDLVSNKCSECTHNTTGER